MTIQTLVSGVQLNTAEVAQKMNLQTDSIIINQCDENSYAEYSHNGHKICCYSFAERGVGLSRNNAFMRSSADIILFSDEDIVYEDGYADMILSAYEANSDCDMILFNMEVSPDRATYHIDRPTRVHRYNCGRYPTYSFSCKRESIMRSNISFSLLFGGGAKYCNGEDSLFIDEAIKKGLKVYALPITIGREVPRPSTWFEGYNDKFFYDRGVLYKHLYGLLAPVMAIRFVYKHRAVLDGDMNTNKALKLMKKGIGEA